MIDETIYDIFKKGSRTYFYSTLFFPPAVKERVFSLYSFVRTADDLVDAVPQRGEEFHAFVDTYRAALEGVPAGDPVIDGFVALQRLNGIEQAWVDAFLFSMEAGPLGSPLPDPRRPARLPLRIGRGDRADDGPAPGAAPACYAAACHLGRGMQDINFIRDIAEDAAMGRVYMPEDELARFGLDSLEEEYLRRHQAAFRAFIHAQCDLVPLVAVRGRDGVPVHPVADAPPDHHRVRYVRLDRPADRARPVPDLRPEGSALRAENRQPFRREYAPARRMTPGREGLAAYAVRLSRPRFWIYTGGTYVVGYSIGMADWHAFLLPAYLVALLYFFFPANLFIYGVNDLFDEATDRNNPKKGEREYRFTSGDTGRLVSLVAFSLVATALLGLAVPDPRLVLVLLGFLFLAGFYSAPPLRFKQVPFLDFCANYLYVMPGVYGFVLASGSLAPRMAPSRRFPADRGHAPLLRDPGYRM